MSKIVERPIPLYKGETRTIPTTWTRNGSPVNLNGYTFSAEVTDVIGGSVYFTMTSAAEDFVITDEVNGKYDIKFTEANLDTIPDSTNTNLTFPFADAVIVVKAVDGASLPIVIFLSELQIFNT